MPTGRRGEKRPNNAKARSSKARSSSEIGDLTTDDGKNAAAVALGRRGGNARAASLGKRQRADIARNAAVERWGKRDRAD